MNFVNSLTWGGWAALAAVPLAIIALYFLKLKRHPVEVPSTFLWTRAIEDLHVNSIWQRLRQNLLLYLQVLLLILIIIACLRPGWRGTELSGNRFIFLIDNSASMKATDGDDGQTRLEVAKERVSELIDQMKRGDQAMIISFSDRYRTVQAYTSNQSELQRELESIQPTTRQTDISVALRAAAGLANPGRSSEAGTNDVQVADAVPATLYIVSDGRFADVQDFSLGNLSPKFVSIGDDNAANVGIVAFSVDQNPEKPNRVQAFARIENYGAKPAETMVALYLNDNFQDVEAVRIPALSESGPGSASVSFYLTGDRVGDLDGDVLTIELKDKRRFDNADSGGNQQALGAAVLKDHFAPDNVAHAVINAPRQARVLLVTPDNVYLRMGLDTEQIRRIAHVDEKTPQFLKTKEYLTAAAAGDYDLIIYDQCAPEQNPQANTLIEGGDEGESAVEKPDYMPQANTLFVGTLPPREGWSRGETKQLPGIIDIDHAHPTMHLMMDLRNAIIFEGFSVKGPPGSKSVVDANLGSLLTIAPREGFEDAVLGFPIITTDENGDSQFNTNWPRLVSFPVFLRNVVTYLGGSHGLFATPNINPGSPATLRSVTPAEEIRVRSPGDVDVKISRGRQNAFSFGYTEKPGVYEIREGTSDKVVQRFAVNLFDSQESNIIPREFAIGHQKVAAESVRHTARQELWKWLLIAGLVVLVVEWYIFNRRVYL